MRRVKNKESILILILSYLVLSILYLLATNCLIHRPYQVWFVPFSIIIAITGWLTDAFIGRYKVICCSVWIMWILMIAVTVSAVMGQFNETYYYYNKTIINSVYCSVCKYWPGWISSQYSSVWTRSAP